jgi:Family of unknown function (DUF6232)
MMAGPRKNDAVVLRSSVGRIRARTISIGSHVIAIDNIGTIRVVRGQRSWWLFFLGVLVIGGGAATTQLSDYGGVAIAVIALGVALAIGSLFQPIESAVLIGTTDGRTTFIVSRDATFLQRLQQTLVGRIDAGDETFLADFDATRGTIVTAVADTIAGGDTLGGGRSPDSTLASPATARGAAPRSAETQDDADDALFADPDPTNPEAKGRESTRVETKTGTAALAGSPAPHLSLVSATQAERRKPFDPLLDGAARSSSRDDDWLAPQTPSTSSPHADSEGRIARTLLALLIVGLLGSGVFAAWYFTGENGPATSVSTIDLPLAASAEGPTETPGSLIQGAEDMPTPVAESVAEERPPADEPAPPPEAPSSLVADAQPEIEDFTPATPMVARASGHRYRASPSAAADIAVLAETRAGGEELNIIARLKQPDGDWYRVRLADSRMAWFKASLAVPRASFAETESVATAQADTSFVASAPQIVQPSEGAQFGGGPQPVRLAWTHREEATLYIVEIEAFDAEAQRWIEDPVYKRVTVEVGTELSDMIPSIGNWRWRVRGVTADGQQSQFSRWSAFGLVN